MPLKRKAISLHWELMFTRSLFHTADMQRQHQILQQVSQLIDDQTLQTTAGEHHGSISAANLRKAHALIESGRARARSSSAAFKSLKHVRLTVRQPGRLWCDFAIYLRSGAIFNQETLMTNDAVARRHTVKAFSAGKTLPQQEIDTLLNLLRNSRHRLTRSRGTLLSRRLRKGGKDGAIHQRRVHLQQP